MSKIQTIKIQNFKAISDLEMDFNGCSCIVTGANNSGKTSFLRGIVDRIRFIRPDVMVKQGKNEGSGELSLDTGEKFVWQFDVAGKDKLTYITKEGRQSVSKELGAQFFPPTFDIDKFLQSSPKDQVKQLQKIVGLDFTDIDDRYKKAYDFRTERNREAELYQAKLTKALRCDPVDYVDLTSLKNQKEAERKRLNDLYVENKAKNDHKRKAWEDDKRLIDRKVQDHNGSQDALTDKVNRATNALETLQSEGYKGTEVFLFIDGLKVQQKPLMIASEMYPKEPTYIHEMPSDETLQTIDNKIFEASKTNALAQKYLEYKELKESTEKAKDAADQADADVKTIEDERRRLVASAKMPEGITISPDGVSIMVDGFLLDKSQISTSKLYCAALKIASINLGEVKSLYFDSTMLDRNTLNDICEWADKNDLQLLMEMVDRDGGEINYTIVEG